jgi:hypothetical protein
MLCSAKASPSPLSPKTHGADTEHPGEGKKREKKQDQAQGPQNDRQKIPRLFRTVMIDEQV